MVYMGRIGRVSEPGVQSSGGSSPSSSSSKLYYYNPKTNSYSTQKIAGQTGVTKGNIGKSAATPSKPSSTPSKKLYFNPQTGTYSTQKIAGQPAVTKQQAKQLSTQTQQIESQQGIREVGGFNTPQADTLGLSSSNFQSGQAQFKGRSELSISSFGSPTFIRQKQGMSSLSTPTISAGSISPPKFQTGGAKFTTRDNIAGSGITTFDSPTFISEGEPRGSSVFLTEPLVRRIVEKTTPTFLKLKTRFYNLPRGKKFKASFEKDYIDIQSMSARHKALEKAGVIDAKGTLGTSTAFKSRSDKIADFDFKVKGVFTDVLAKATTRLKKTSQEDIITVGSLAGDTAAIVYPTTRILSIGGDVARGSKFISSLPTGLKGAAKLGTYIGEMEAFRKIALDVLDYKQTELGRQYTDFVGYLQAESFANIEGGGIMKTLAGTKKKITAGKYMKTRLYPGFVEGSVGYNVLMDSERGQIDVKSIGIPFTKASFPIPEFSLGGGLFPGKQRKEHSKQGEY